MLLEQSICLLRLLHFDVSCKQSLLVAECWSRQALGLTQWGSSCSLWTISSWNSSAIRLERTCKACPVSITELHRLTGWLGLEGIQEVQYKIWILYLVGRKLFIIVINYNTVGSTWKSRNTFPWWSWLSTDTNCSGGWWSLHPEKTVKSCLNTVLDNWL